MDSGNEALRGDAVGGTVYSEGWILRLLIDLTKIMQGGLEFSKEIEDGLCTLWDMAVEEDIVMLLKRHDMIMLSLNTILKTDNPRLHEILMGIIGNMCFLKRARVESGRNREIMQLLSSLLSHDDAATLIQVVRVLHTFACDIRAVKQLPVTNQLGVQITAEEGGGEIKANVTSGKGSARGSQGKLDADGTVPDKSIDQEISGQPSSHPTPFVQEQEGPSTEVSTPNRKKGREVLSDIDLWNDIFPNMMFILYSTRNVDLIVAVWTFLQTVLYIRAGNGYMYYFFSNENMLTSLLESFNEFHKSCIIDCETEVEQKYRTAIEAWVSIIHSCTLRESQSEVLSKYKEPIRSNIGEILRLFPNFHPCNEEFESCLSSALTVLEVLMEYDTCEASSIVLCIQNAANLKVYLEGQMKGKLEFKEDVSSEVGAIANLECFFLKIFNYYCPKDGFDSIEDALKRCVRA